MSADNTASWAHEEHESKRTMRAAIVAGVNTQLEVHGYKSSAHHERSHRHRRQHTARHMMLRAVRTMSADNTASWAHEVHQSKRTMSAAIVARVASLCF